MSSQVKVNQAVNFSKYIGFKPNSVLVATFKNKSNVSTPLTIKRNGAYAQYSVPADLVTEANLPASVTLTVDGNLFDTDDLSVASTGSGSTVEIENATGGAINTSALVSGQDAGGVPRVVRTDTAGNQRINNTVTNLGSGQLTANGQTFSVQTDGHATITAYLYGAAHAGITVAFEQSFDGTNWFSATGASTGSNSGGVSAVLSTNSWTAWRIGALGAAYVRVRLTAFTSGTLSVFFVGTAGAIDPSPLVPTHAVTGSGTFTVAGTATTTPVSPSLYSLVSLATTNLVSIKTTAASIYGYRVDNTSGATIYVKLYNKASAPVLATDTPLMTIPVAAGTVVDIPLGATGRRFVTGLAIAITGARIKTDATAVAAGIEVLIDYI